MESKRESINSLLMEISELIERGGIIQICDINMNSLSLPQMIDELMLSNIKQDKETLCFWMAWRPVGMTAQFDSGAFNVEEAEYALIIDFKIEGESIKFIREHADKSRDVLLISPLTDEYLDEWQAWNRFKKRNRDHFEDLQISMVQILKEKEKEADISASCE